MMVQHNCTPAEKVEREVRIRKADEDAKQAAERKADRDRAKVARDAERVALRAIQPARSAAGMMRAEPTLLDSDEDEDDDYFPQGSGDEDDEDDGFLAPEFDLDEAWRRILLQRREEAVRMRGPNHWLLDVAPPPPAAAAAAASPAMEVFGGPSFSVDIAPNARSKCRICNITIQKFALRIKQHVRHYRRQI